MPATIAVRSVHPDLPVEEAWQQGRRLYARCSASSPLSGALRRRGAQWDPYVKALWVSTRHRDDFTEHALEHHQYQERAQQIRQAGLWVHIPYDAELIRARAKELGAIFDGETKRWGAPSPADLVELEELVEVWQRARQAERAEAERQRRAAWETERLRRELLEAERRHAAEQQDARREEARLEAAAQREAERLKAVARADTFRAELARTVGRTLVGHLERRRDIFPRYTSGDQARAAAPHVGAVLRLEDGRRALVWGRTVRFVPRAKAAELGVNRAHWYAEYRLAVVAPTEDELDVEAARARALMDAHELRALVSDAALLSAPVPVDRPTRVPDPVASITVTTGVNGLVPAGRLTLDAAGVVWWQHPGHYESYQPVQGISRDSELTTRVRAALADGPRRRTLPPDDPGGQPLHYEVVCHGRHA